MISYSIEEAAAKLLGDDSNGEPLPGKVKWLSIRLRDGSLPGYKAGRQWRMTEADLVEAVERLRPQRLPQVPVMSGLTRTSRRRLAAS